MAKKAHGGKGISGKGSIHIIAVFVLLLALIGIWYVVTSIQQHMFAQNMQRVLTDYKGWAMSVVKNPAERKELQRSFDSIESITNKYRQQKSPYAPLPQPPDQQ